MEEIVCTDAEWDINLDVTCPHCEHFFDLTDYITMGELPLIQSHFDLELDVICPECLREFRITQIHT